MTMFDCRVRGRTLRALWCAGAAWLAASAGAYPLDLDGTVMRTTATETVRGVKHEVVHKAQGDRLDERHLVRNDTGKADARVHIALTQTGDDSYLLQLQSQDLGSADHYRAHVRLAMPREISCRGGYWTMVDVELLQDDLAQDTRGLAWLHLDDRIEIGYRRGQREPFHFTGGQVQIAFRVVEACV